MATIVAYNRELTATFDKSRSEKEAFWWDVAKKITFVALLALAALPLTLYILFSPDLSGWAIAVITIASATLFQIADDSITPLFDKVIRDHQYQAVMAGFYERTPEESSHHLRTAKAHLLYLEREKEELTAQAGKSFLDYLGRVEDSPTEKERNDYAEFHHNARQALALCKLKKAYFTYLEQQPDSLDSFEDLCTVTETSCAQRWNRMKFAEATQSTPPIEIFANFKNGNSFSLQEVLDRDDFVNLFIGRDI